VSADIIKNNNSDISVVSLSYFNLAMCKMKLNSHIYTYMIELRYLVSQGPPNLCLRAIILFDYIIGHYYVKKPKISLILVSIYLRVHTANAVLEVIVSLYQCDN
jgi:hypothetical protein